MPLGTLTENLPPPSEVTLAQTGPVRVMNAAYALLVCWNF